MSGFGSGSFGGFGSNSQQGSGFGSGSGFGTGGGFGSNTTAQTTPLFGSQNSGFGSAQTTTGGGGLFGSTANQPTSGFGSTGGGFGSNTNTSGGMFGGNRPTGSFGPGTTQGGSLFGGGGGGGGFGSTTTPAGGFGGGTGTALGGNVPPAEGTATTPFSPYTEKDTGSSVTNHFQNISVMSAYNKYSPEELRVADYAQGRRYGNASGQPGAFGSSAFGGFGQQQNTGGFGSATTNSPFGAATSAPSGFGQQQQQQQTSGFGSTGGNSLFGANKPATGGGLFGQTSTSQPGGFGSTGAATGGFGSNAGTTGFGGNTGGGLFGGQNQQQNKGGLFGSTGSTFGGGGGFGQQQNTTTSASPFGATTATASPFGQQQQGSTGFGGFGQNQNQTQNKPVFGGGGGFGSNTQQQQQPGSNLFGGGNTGGTGSLFSGGNQQQNQGTSSLFGNTANQQTGGTGGGLFPNTGQQQQQQDQKPGGLFGGLGGGTSTTGTSAFGGFGNTQNQQTGGSSLFGNTGQQQQQKPSLFGPSASQPTSLFGQNTSTSGGTSGGLFNLGGNNQNQQQQQQPGGGLNLGTNSLFGGSQQSQQPQAQQQQQQPQPGSFQASLLDGNPYGSQSIFSGVPPPNAPSPGPLATPLSASMRQKQRTPLPIHKISPNAANRLITPPTRQGYGFSYSTYGTPSSVSSTPANMNASFLGGSLRGGSLGRSFGKSMSTSNLRKTYDAESDSILSPGAFAPGTSRYSGGSLKRLTIDRSLRTDLFSPRPQQPALTNGEDSANQGSKLKKKVSFDSAAGGDVGQVDGAVVHVDSAGPEPTPEEIGFLRSARKQFNGVQSNGVNGTASDSDTVGHSDTDVVRGNELAVVPEDSEDRSLSQAPQVPSVPAGDPSPGDYWMKPSREEISKMTREEQKHVVGFAVGRTNCGYVTFDKPVDLTTVDLDSVFGDIVSITMRTLAVYSDDSTKPPRGKGLNVPSTIRLENSWPRGRDRKSPIPITSGPWFDKHVDRLRQVDDTEFVEYNKMTGVWTFRVPHFTTYGFDYDDDEGESFDQSTLSAPPPDTPTPNVQTQDQTPTQSSKAVSHGHSELDSTFSIDDSYMDGSMMEDDTFEFKKQKLVPGAFSNQEANNIGQTEVEDISARDESDGSDVSQSDVEKTGSPMSAGSEASFNEDEDEDITMAGSFPAPENSTQLLTESPLKHTMQRHTQGTPTKTRLDLTGTWADQLQRTISPRKQDRQALREIQENAFADRHDNDSSEQKTAEPVKEPGFKTSIDLMNSLFRQPGTQKQAAAGKDVKAKGFEWPYHKKPKTFAGDQNEMSENDIRFHKSFKPRWSHTDSLVLPVTHPNNGGRKRGAVKGDPESNIGMLKFEYTVEPQDMLLAQKESSQMRLVDNAPFARLAKLDFQAQANLVDGDSPVADMERYAWQLAHILFDDNIQDDLSAGLPEHVRDQYLYRIKKDRLSRLWESIIRDQDPIDIDAIESAEERAIAYLCSHRVDEACQTLIEARNFHLGTLISQIAQSQGAREELQKQIDTWKQHNVYSEMTEPIRALYELLAGNCLRSDNSLRNDPRPTIALEDRASTFYFSKRFELDWFQAFGLRLWYGIIDEDPIEAAVSLFHRDITQGDEPSFPFSLPSKHKNTDSRERESPLWIILKTYAAAMSKGQATDIPPVQLPAILLPDAMTGDALRNRFSFQLFHHLCTAVGERNGVVIDNERADQLALDYAAELESGNQYPAAIFVLLHLRGALERERSLKEALSQFAPWLPCPSNPDGTPDVMWNYFVEDLQIPAAWLWLAKALHARYQKNSAIEVECLLHAKHWNDAHETFRRFVGPRAIIERDYVTLEALISGFGDAPDKKVRGWASGAAVYKDFLSLVRARGGPRDPARLKRLVSALANLTEKVEKSPFASLEERVAFREISRVVAGWCSRDAGSRLEPSTILNLPLTQDARLSHTAEMSRRYYSLIMAGGN